MPPSPLAPLLIEFIADTRIHREPTVIPRLPIVGNGPPGTFVLFGNGRRVSLPTDQIVATEAGVAGTGARVGFGGMAFDGLRDGTLMFRRIFDVQPVEQLSSERSRRMTLDPQLVAVILVDGIEVWPLLS